MQGRSPQGQPGVRRSSPACRSSRRHHRAIGMQYGSIVVVTDQFDAWLDQVAPRDPHDPGGFVLQVPIEWLRATFDRHGPLSADELHREASKRVALVARGVSARPGSATCRS